MPLPDRDQAASDPRVLSGAEEDVAPRGNDAIDSTAASRCEANVWVRPGYWHKFQCKRKASTTINDGDLSLPLCNQHAKIAQKRGVRYVQ